MSTFGTIVPSRRALLLNPQEFQIVIEGPLQKQRVPVTGSDAQLMYKSQAVASIFVRPPNLKRPARRPAIERLLPVN